MSNSREIQAILKEDKKDFYFVLDFSSELKEAEALGFIEEIRDDYFATPFFRKYNGPDLQNEKNEVAQKEKEEKEKEEKEKGKEKISHQQYFTIEADEENENRYRFQMREDEENKLAWLKASVSLLSHFFKDKKEKLQISLEVENDSYQGIIKETLEQINKKSAKEKTKEKEYESKQELKPGRGLEQKQEQVNHINKKKKGIWYKIKSLFFKSKHESDERAYQLNQTQEKKLYPYREIWEKLQDSLLEEKIISILEKYVENGQESLLGNFLTFHWNKLYHYSHTLTIKAFCEEFRNRQNFSAEAERNPDSSPHVQKSPMKIEEIGRRLKALNLYNNHGTLAAIYHFIDDNAPLLGLASKLHGKAFDPAEDLMPLPGRVRVPWHHRPFKSEYRN